MTIQTLILGAPITGAGGDKYREAHNKINANFVYVDSRIAALESRPVGDAGVGGIQGEQGEQGDPFLYADFTAEQLVALKGEKGDKGDKGLKGDTGDKGDTGLKGDAFVYADFTAPQLAGLKGVKGVKGDKGDKGEQGVAGTDGINATNETVKNQNTGLNTKIWIGTQSEYDAVVTKDSDTLYMVK